MNSYRRWFSLIELVTALAVVMVLVALALPAHYNMQLKARYAEIEVLGGSLADLTRTFSEVGDADQLVGFGTMNAFCPDNFPGKSARPWKSTACQEMANGATVVGWQPDGDVRGSYFMCVNATTCGPKDWWVFVMINVDGDGTLAEYQGYQQADVVTPYAFFRCENSIPPLPKELCF